MLQGAVQAQDAANRVGLEDDNENVTEIWSENSEDSENIPQYWTCRARRKKQMVRKKAVTGRSGLLRICVCWVRKMSVPVSTAVVVLVVTSQGSRSRGWGRRIPRSRGRHESRLLVCR